MQSILNDWQTVESSGAEVIAAANPDWNENELEKIFREAIKTCASWCMEYNTGGWIFTTLSGGLDSSFCIYVIRDFLPKAIIRTYTIGGNREHPDVQAARLIAKEFKTVHTEITPKEDEERHWKKAFRNAFPDAKPFTDGDIAVFTVLKTMALLGGAKAVITHDGIDELLGGYWRHRFRTGKLKRNAFRRLWGELIPNHLKPLQRSADHFGIKLLLPYLQLPVIDYIAGIPVAERTSHEESKIPLRNIARKYLPSEIINREKLGFSSALRKF